MDPRVGGLVEEHPLRDALDLRLDAPRAVRQMQGHVDQIYLGQDGVLHGSGGGGVQGTHVADEDAARL